MAVDDYQISHRKDLIRALGEVRDELVKRDKGEPLPGVILNPTTQKTLEDNFNRKWNKPNPEG